jgi:hypothetical protein
MMQYLLNTKKRKAKAHIWNAEKQDTVCRMYSTGNLSDNHYVKSDHLYDKTVCSICEGMNDHNEYNNRLTKQIEYDQKNSTYIATELIDDNRLSLTAKGIALEFYYCANKEGLFSVSHIRSKRFHNSAEINQGLHELEEYGYIEQVDESAEIYKITIWRNILPV